MTNPNDKIEPRFPASFMRELTAKAIEEMKNLEQRLKERYGEVDCDGK